MSELVQAAARPRFAVAILAAWLIGSTLLGGAMLLRHQPLAVPQATDDRLRAAVDEMFVVSPRWRAVHVMYRACACSRKTIAHLLARGALRHVDEVVLIVDDERGSDERDTALAKAGYVVHVITVDELHARFGLHAAPVLIVARPDGALAYVGGYNRHKQSPRFEDVAILAELIKTHAPPRLPVYGCEVSTG